MADSLGGSSRAGVNARLANDQKRRDALSALSSGEMTVRELITLSNMDGNGDMNGAPYRKIKLVDIMMARGWDKDPAVNALIRSGWGKNDKLSDIRKFSLRSADFLMLLRMGQGRWVPKPLLSSGFPKEGSLAFVMDVLVDSGFVFPPSVAVTLDNLGARVHPADYGMLKAAGNPENAGPVYVPDDDVVRREDSEGDEPDLFDTGSVDVLSDEELFGSADGGVDGSPSTGVQEDTQEAASGTFGDSEGSSEDWGFSGPENGSGGDSDGVDDWF